MPRLRILKFYDGARIKEDDSYMTQAYSVSRGPADSDGSAGAPLVPKNCESPEVLRKSRTCKARQKKFHQHFKQVDVEEKLLNYYSCALVGDILLQGHLYITENFFAFYSNVFGYVTKLLIPTVDVLKISKEKTAKIIPNAVGISTEDEKHVFGSLLSRDSTYKFMLEVWKASVSSNPVVNNAPPATIQPDLASDYDSTVSSGNEEEQSFMSSLTTGASSDNLHKLMPRISFLTTALKVKQFDFRFYSFKMTTILFLIVILLLSLFLSSGYLLYRIALIQNHLKDLSITAKGDIYDDVLKWHAALHSTSANKINEFLNMNLNQIAKVRLSLEALSKFILPQKNKSEPPDLRFPWENADLKKKRKNFPTNGN